jgi:hypothetical protein
VVLIAVGMSLFLLSALRRAMSEQYVWSTLPHFRYWLMSVTEQEVARKQAQALVEAAAGEPLFILQPAASFSYLVTGLKNPTPFDYPLVTAFGTKGEEEVMAAIASRRLRRVCWQRVNGPLAPARLERYVEENLEQEKQLGWCAIYRVRP